MKCLGYSLVVVAVLIAPAASQQPNTPLASMVWGGNDPGVYPITTNWSSTVIGMTVSGINNQGYMVARSNALNPGLLSIGPQGVVDLSLLGLGFVMDGISFSTGTFLDQLANTGPTGTSVWTFPIASNGNLGAFQAAVLSPGAPGGAGFTLSAATDVIINVAQNLVATIPLGGDDITANVSLLFGTTDFYDQNYTDLFISTNGCVTFGGADANGVPTNTDFDLGFPRVAPLWTNLLPGAAVPGQGNLLFTFFEDLSGWTVRWVLMDSYSNPIPGPSTPAGNNGNTYSVTYNYGGPNPGSFVFDFTTPEPIFNPPVPGGVVTTWGISGITPGGSMASSPTNPASLPLSGNIHVSDYTTELTHPNIGGSGVATGNTDESYRTDVNNFPAATMSGTGVTVTFVPIIFAGGAGTANTYVLF